jgi:hypothetical protein
MEGLCTSLLSAARSSEEGSMEIDGGSNASEGQRGVQERAVMAEFSKFLTKIVGEATSRTAQDQLNAEMQVAEENKLMSLLLNS